MGWDRAGQCRPYHSHARSLEATRFLVAKVCGRARQRQQQQGGGVALRPRCAVQAGATGAWRLLL
jgi:hypothetical protein